MNDTVNLGVLVEDGVEAGLVRHVDFVEGGALAREKFNAVDSNLGGVVETIDNDDIVAVLEKSESRKGADVASTTASHKNQYMDAMCCCSLFLFFLVPPSLLGARRMGGLSFGFAG